MLLLPTSTWVFPFSTAQVVVVLVIRQPQPPSVHKTFFSAFPCPAMPGTFTSELRPSMCFTIWPMLQVANFSKDFPSQNRETKTERTATATELECRAILARRSGLPTLSLRTLGAWGSSQNRAQASKPKELTSKLQASRPNSTDCPISTPRAVLNSKVSQQLSLGCLSGNNSNVKKKGSPEFEVDQKRPGTTWSKGPAKSTLSANSRQRQFLSTSTFQSPSTEPRHVPPKRPPGGTRSTEARYVLGTGCIHTHFPVMIMPTKEGFIAEKLSRRRSVKLRTAFLCIVLPNFAVNHSKCLCKGEKLRIKRPQACH